MEDVVETQTGYMLLIPGCEKEDNFGIQAKVPEPQAEEDPLEALKRERQNLHNTHVDVRRYPSGLGASKGGLLVLLAPTSLALPSLYN